MQKYSSSHQNSRMIAPTIEDSLDYDTIGDTVENEIAAAYHTSPVRIGQLFDSPPYSWIIVDDFACFQYATYYSIAECCVSITS